MRWSILGLFENLVGFGQETLGLGKGREVIFGKFPEGVFRTLWAVAKFYRGSVGFQFAVSGGLGGWGSSPKTPRV